MTKGKVFNIQRFSTSDGPGIRTVVFLKGCPLSCVWCHNPEGLLMLPQLQFFEEKCIGCGMCAKNCPANCIVGEKKSRHVIEQNKCLKCGQCEKTCKFGAIIKK